VDRKGETAGPWALVRIGTRQRIRIGRALPGESGGVTFIKGLIWLERTDLTAAESGATDASVVRRDLVDRLLRRSLGFGRGQTIGEPLHRGFELRDLALLAIELVAELMQCLVLMGETHLELVDARVVSGVVSGHV
jgi:hypothetical protein